MLGLLTPTDSRWIASAEADLPGLLSDHAHCELKAAVSALSLVSRFGPIYPVLVAPLSALAHEETLHFQAVTAELSARAAQLGKQDRDAYVNALWNLTKTERDRIPVLCDRLLVSALIEARSCERFRLLSEHLSEPVLRVFYRELMESEARHYRVFCALAEEIFGVMAARDRLSVLARRREASVADMLPLGPKVHG